MSDVSERTTTITFHYPPLLLPLLIGVAIFWIGFFVGWLVG